MHQHDHSSGGGHHSTQRSAGARYQRSLVLAFTMLTAYMVVEAAAGFALGSLALISDAGHMLSDVVALGLSLAAIWFAQRPATPARTYGFYRLEILAAAVNASMLFLLGAWIVVEAWRRVQEPPSILAMPMIVVAVGGLVVSAVAMLLLRKGSGESLNLRGAYLETLSDMLGFLGTIVAGGVIAVTGWQVADTIAAVFIGVLILPRTATLLKSAIDVLMEATPLGVDVTDIATAMGGVAGVVAVHDLHVWSITSGFVAMSGHVVAADRPGSEVLHDIHVILHDRYEIEHATIQVERLGHAEDGVCCASDPRCLLLGVTTGPAGIPATL